MARSVTELLLKITGDSKEAVASLNKIEGRIKGFGKNISTALKTTGALLIADQLIDFGQQALDAGLRAEEAANKFKEVFGPAVQSAGTFVDEYANKLGQTEGELQGTLGTIGAVVQGMGVAQGLSAEVAVDIVQMAADFASFHDTSVEQAINAIIGGITGEREALKKYGIVIKETEVQQRALMMTGKAHVSELTKQERAFASIQLMTENAGKAMGDFERTMDGNVAKIREMQGSFAQLKEDIGEKLTALVPIATEVSQKLLDFFGSGGLLGIGIGELKERFTTAGRAAQDMKGDLEDLAAASGDLTDGEIRTAIEEFAKYDARLGGTGEALVTLRNELDLTDDEWVKHVESLKENRAELELSEGQLASIEAELRRLRNDGIIPTVAEITELNDAVKTKFHEAQQSFKDDVAEMEAELKANNEAFRTWESELDKTLQDAVTLFDGAADEIDTSVEEMLSNITEQVNQNRDFQGALVELAGRGLDDLVAELEAAGPGAAQAAQDFLADPIAASLAEANLGEVTQDEIDDVMLKLAQARGPLPKAASTLAKDLGFRWDSSLQAWVDSTGRRVTDILREMGKLDGKKTFSTHTHTIDVQVRESAAAAAIGTGSSTIFAFQHGGRHPANQPILVGERGPELLFPDTPGRVMNNHDTQRAMGGGVTIIVEGNLIHEREMIEIVERELARIGRRTGVL